MKKNYDFSKATGRLHSSSIPARAMDTASWEDPTDKNLDDISYIDLVKRSLESIGPGYIKLATTYEPSGIVRERVLCYELYHQIRLHMPDDCVFSLNGEIDKRGHLDFQPADQKNPDFVFHVPGTHDGNTLVVEVKGTLSRHKEIVQDFAAILRFINTYQYQSGIFIIYNHSVHELLEAVGKELRELASDPSAYAVHILAMKEAHASCEVLSLSELLVIDESGPTSSLALRTTTLQEAAA